MDNSGGTTAVRGAELLVQCLEAQGVKYIFGIPGAKVDAIFDVLADHGPKLILCRHEQNAAFMAGMVGRLTGKPGVCLVTSGPGVTNLPTGLATATTEGYPVVALGGNVPRAMRLKQTHQGLANEEIMKPVTKYSVEVTDPLNIPEVIANAFRISMQARPGAAFISFPQDILTDDVTATPITPKALPASKLYGQGNVQCLDDAVALISKAELPVILAGMLAVKPDVVAALHQLLERYPMPVINTYQGAGVLSRDLLACYVGRVGLFHNQPGDILLDKADLVITVGFDPVEYDPVIWNQEHPATLISIDEQLPDIDQHFQPTVEILGDMAVNLGSLRDRLPECENDVTETPFILDLQDKLLEIKASGADKDGTPVHPLRLIYELRTLIDDDVTVICDIGSIYIWMARYFTSYKPNRLLFSNGQQTLGVALPWAMATSMVRKGEKVISMSGDGGFLFSAMELETAVREQCDFVHLVWRDGAYNMVEIQQDLKYGRSFGVNFNSPDIVKFAEAFGATGLRIEHPDEIRPVLEKALTLAGPVLIDIPIDYSDNLALCQSVREHIGN